MKISLCDHCHQLLFFENTECVTCGHRVAYLPDLQIVGSLDPDGDDNPLCASCRITRSYSPTPRRPSCGLSMRWEMEVEGRR